MKFSLCTNCYVALFNIKTLVDTYVNKLYNYRYVVLTTLFIKAVSAPNQRLSVQWQYAVSINATDCFLSWVRFERQMNIIYNAILIMCLNLSKYISHMFYMHVPMYVLYFVFIVLDMLMLPLTGPYSICKKSWKLFSNWYKEYSFDKVIPVHTSNVMWLKLGSIVACVSLTITRMWTDVSIRYIYK